MLKHIILFTIGTYSLYTLIMTMYISIKIVNSRNKDTAFVKALYRKFKFYFVTTLLIYNITMFINDTTLEEKLILLGATVMFYILVPRTLRIFANRDDFLSK